MAGHGVFRTARRQGLTPWPWPSYPAEGPGSDVFPRPQLTDGELRISSSYSWRRSEWGCSLLLLMNEIFKKLKEWGEGALALAGLGLNSCSASARFESLSKPFHLPKPRFPHLWKPMKIQWNNIFRVYSFSYRCLKNMFYFPQHTWNSSAYFSQIFLMESLQSVPEYT